MTVARRCALGKKRRLLWALLSLWWITPLTGTATLAQVAPSLHPSFARGRNRPLRLSAGQLLVSPGATCLAPAELARRLTEWLGKDPLDPRLRIEVHGDAQLPRKLSFSLWQRDHKLSERRFDDSPADCAQLHAVVALSMAIAVRDTLLEDLGVRVQKEDEHGRGSADLAALIGTGFGPGVNGGIALGLGATVYQWLELRGDVLGLRSQEGRFADVPGSFDLSLAGVGLQACAHAGGRARVGVRLCTGPLVGALLARGHDYERSLREAGAYVGWLGRTDLLIRLTSRWALTLGMLGSVPIVHPDLLLRDPQQRVIRRQRLDAVGVVSTLGLGWLF